MDLLPRRDRSVQIPQKLDLSKEQVDDLKRQLRLLLEYVVGDVDETSMGEDRRAVVCKNQRFW